MTILFLFFKNLHVELKNLIFNRIETARSQANNPSCRFYFGTKIHNVIFGSNVVLFENVRIENCQIGSFSYVQKKSTVFNAEIGKFCSIASNVSIGPGVHQTDGVSLHPVFFSKDTPLPLVFSKENRIENFKKTLIGNDVWIGERSIILDGVEIGTGAIIAAGSIVTQNVPPYSIVGGVPAKEIKKRFSNQQIIFLLNSKWWLKTDSWLFKNCHLFSDVNSFLELIKNDE